MTSEKKRITFEEAKALYPDEWVVFSETVVDENQELLDGVLYFHGRDHDEALEKMAGVEGDASIDFTGTRHYERIIKIPNAKIKPTDKAA